MLSRALGMLQVGCCLKGSYRESHLTKSLFKLWNFHDEPFLLCVTGWFSGRNKGQALCLLPSQFTPNPHTRWWANSLSYSRPAYFPLQTDPIQPTSTQEKVKHRLHLHSEASLATCLLQGITNQHPWPHPCSMSCWNHCIWSQICSWQLKLLLQFWWTQRNKGLNPKHWEGKRKRESESVSGS